MNVKEIMPKKRTLLRIKNALHVSDLTQDPFAIVRFIISFFFSLLLVSTIIGVLASFFGVKWGWGLFVAITLSTVVVSMIIQPIIRNVSNVQTVLAIVSLIIILMSSVYNRYSPVIEIRQDPSIYIFKAFNLVNHGTLYKPLDTMGDLIKNNLKKKYGYAGFQNGTIVDSSGMVHGDFYPGGTFFYAYLGTINRSLVYWGPVLCSYILFLMLFITIQNVLNDKNPFLSFLITLTFAYSPLLTWFGRAPYSSIPAAFSFLLIFYIFLEQKSGRKKDFFLLIAMMGAISFRIDNIILIYIVVMLLGLSRPRYGLISIVLLLIYNFLLSHVSPIYSSRIGDTSFVFKYINYIIPAIFFSSLLIRKMFRIDIVKIVNNKYIWFVVFAVLFVCAFFIFHDNTISINGYEEAFIHGRTMRTYNEETMERLFKLYPSFLIIMSLLSLPLIQKKKDIDNKAKVFLALAVIAHCSLLIDIRNSPQMYWALRRFIPVFFPGLFIGYTLFVNKVNSVKLQMIVTITMLMLTYNLYLNSNQEVEYENLDKSVLSFIKEYPESNDYLFIYEEDYRTEISPLVTYANYDFVPVKSISELVLYNQVLTNTGKEIMYIGKSDLGIPYKMASLSFIRTGETYDRLPEERYPTTRELKIYEYGNIIENFFGNNIIWPSDTTIVEGFHDDKVWTYNHLTISNLLVDVGGQALLKIERYGLDNSYKKLGVNNEVQIFLDGHLCELFYYGSTALYYQIPDLDFINKFEMIINSNNRSQSDSYGMDVKEISLVRSFHDNEIWSPSTQRTEGLYGDGPWTSGCFTISEIEKKIESVPEFICIERMGYRHPFASDMNSLNPTLTINGFNAVFSHYRDDVLFFHYPNNVNYIFELHMKVNPFKPKDYKINGDGRSLGLDIKTIYLK